MSGRDWAADWDFDPDKLPPRPAGNETFPAMPHLARLPAPARRLAGPPAQAARGARA